MKVKVEVYDGIPLSATVPKHVICTVKETPPPVKGVGVTPRSGFLVCALLYFLHDFTIHEPETFSQLFILHTR